MSCPSCPKPPSSPYESLIREQRNELYAVLVGAGLVVFTVVVRLVLALGGWWPW